MVDAGVRFPLPAPTYKYEMRDLINIIEENQQLNFLNLRKGFVINPNITDKVILHQQNVGAQQDVYEYLLQRGASANVAKWFSSTFLNAMLRRISKAYAYDAACIPLDDYLELYLDLVPEDEDSRTKEEIFTDLPEWSKNGVVLFPFGFEAYIAGVEDDDGFQIPLQNVDEPYEFNSLIDFLNYFAQNRDNSLSRLSAQDAVRLSNIWHNTTGNQIGSETGKEVMSFPDGYRILQLETPKQLDYESKHCRHCIGKGGYDSHLTKPDGFKIFSLRNENNLPVVTISVNPSTRMIDQMQGHENSPPPQEVYEHLKTFMVAAHLRFRNSEQAKRNFGVEAKIDF